LADSKIDSKIFESNRPCLLLYSS